MLHSSAQNGQTWHCLHSPLHANISKHQFNSSSMVIIMRIQSSHRHYYEVTALQTYTTNQDLYEANAMCSFTKTLLTL